MLKGDWVFSNHFADIYKCVVAIVCELTPKHQHLSLEFLQQIILMSKKLIITNHKNVERELELIIKYGLEIIIPNKISPFSDFEKKKKQVIVEGLFLKACAVWEKFVETEVVLLVNMDITKLLEEFELPMNTVLNPKIVKSMIFSNLYRDFNDIDKSKNFFKTFIVPTFNLFESITNEQLKKIRIVYKLRNYLAHYSEFAKKKLLQEYLKNYKSNNFKDPGNFLMENSGKYFEKLIHNFCLSSSKMREKLNNHKI